jgi:hypothetical protein
MQKQASRGHKAVATLEAGHGDLGAGEKACVSVELVLKHIHRLVCITPVQEGRVQMTAQLLVQSWKDARFRDDSHSVHLPSSPVGELKWAELAKVVDDGDPACETVETESGCDENCCCSACACTLANCGTDISECP